MKTPVAVFILPVWLVVIGHDISQLASSYILPLAKFRLSPVDTKTVGKETQFHNIFGKLKLMNKMNS